MVHVAMMEDEFVRRRGWLSREHFLDLWSATHLIPGPNSTEMAIHIGHLRGALAFDILRRWLKHPEDTRRPDLERELLALAALFAPALEATGEPERSQSTTVVITVSGGAPDTESVVEQVREALNRANG